MEHGGFTTRPILSRRRRGLTRPTFHVAGCLILAATPCLHAAVPQQLAATLAKLPHREAVVGACAIDLQSGQIIFAQNEDHAMVPASTQKVFTMAAALAELGPDFGFETTLATDGQHLVVIGAGDPAFGDEKIARARGESITAGFERWADVLRRRGLTDLTGDLVIDESIFETQMIHPSWEPRDIGKWYAAPVAGLNINDNCLDVTVVPGGKPGSRTSVVAVPDNGLASFDNKCETGRGKSPILHHKPNTFDYIISGTCRKRWTFSPVAFPDPGLLFADSLRTFLTERDIRIGGTKRLRVCTPAGRLPPRLAVLSRERTSIAEVLRRTGKDSQNLFADALFKRAGFERAVRRGESAPRGSWVSGSQAVMDVVTRAGIEPAGLSAVDGSGLSRENRCTARQLAQMMAWMVRQPFGPLFQDSISIAGVDGSLRKRLRDIPGRVRGKTGTMRSVRALAGYAYEGDRPRFAFAVIFNGYRGPSTPYREIQDRFCRVLVSAATPPAGSN